LPPHLGVRVLSWHDRLLQKGRQELHRRKQKMTIRSSTRFLTLRLVAALFALALVVASPALATPLTFAQYFQLNGRNSSGRSLTRGPPQPLPPAAMFFQLLGVSGLPFAGPRMRCSL